MCASTGLSAASPIAVGRFAPSPTGALHFGSLVAALASYLNVKSKGGIWQLRIDDIDPPREQPDAAKHIVSTLTQFGLHHDGPITWQSQQFDGYRAALQRLIEVGHAFPCFCTRSQLAGAPHQGRCASKSRHQPSWRLLVPDFEIQFIDQIFGKQSQNLRQAIGDFVLWRSDDLPSYQLACVVDDAATGVTEIVRGADLLDATPRQIYLQQLLGFRTPHYAHVPLVLGADGQKLSKQNLAPALDAARILETLEQAFAFLSQTQLLNCTPETWLTHASKIWRLANINGARKDRRDITNHLISEPTRQMQR
jgi:glutamyl-Q tRNA(Asp) synthetase